MVEDWSMRLPLNLIYEVSSEFKLSSYIVAAMVSVETQGMFYKCRYEPNYSYLHEVEKYARILSITEETERMQQKTSYGLMQIMGATARWIGYESDLPKLSQPKTGLYWGCKYFKKLFKKYDCIQDAVSAYNQGSPKKVDGGSRYLNQDYVDKVAEKYFKLSGISL